MKSSELVKAIFRYIKETEPGSFIDTVVSNQPVVSNNKINADLHTHPYISSISDLYDTLDILVKHNVDLCAITVRAKGDNKEFDFRNVKNLIEGKKNLASKLDYGDHGKFFQVNYNDKTLRFVGAYETEVLLDGVNGKLHVVSLMPDLEFEEYTKDGRKLEECIKLSRDYGSIIIGAHPYTIWDPHGPKNIIKFRLATPDERKRINNQLFPVVDAVDLVSSNCLWMIKSSELLQGDLHEINKQLEKEGYKIIPLLGNSDARARSHYTRNEIGRSGNIFELSEYESDDELRAQLRNKIELNDFEKYFQHTPSLRFLYAVLRNKIPTNILK